MLFIPSLCHKLSHLLGPPSPLSVTYFMDGPNAGRNGENLTFGLEDLPINCFERVTT